MSVTNTSKQVREMPELMIAEIMGGGASKTIERQEAQGQCELVKSDVLPIEGIERCRQMIESAGGSIGEPVQGDELFINVVLPPGWSKKATSHVMHSNLVDANGHIRAGIFYKAAFYDRSAHIRPVQRFSINNYSHEVEGETKSVVVDIKGEVKFESEVVKYADRNERWSAVDKTESQVKAWLAEHYPNWQSADAYWA